MFGAIRILLESLKLKPPQSKAREPLFEVRLGAESFRPVAREAELRLCTSELADEKILVPLREDQFL